MYKNTNDIIHLTVIYERNIGEKMPSLVNYSLSLCFLHFHKSAAFSDGLSPTQLRSEVKKKISPKWPRLVRTVTYVKQLQVKLYEMEEK